MDRKQDASKDLLNEVMYMLYESLRTAITLLQAILPDTATHMLTELSVKEENRK